MPAVDDDLGVAAAAERIAEGTELPPNLREIVDFAIVAYPDRPVRACHRLMAGGRRVDDRQTRMGEPGLSVGPNAFIVRPPMPHRRDHLPQLRLDFAPR